MYLKKKCFEQTVNVFYFEYKLQEVISVKNKRSSLHTTNFIV